jgi:nucleoside-diphosphate-sugar epimerase
MNEYGQYEGKTVLVTGGAGCIGSNLCKRLSEMNAKEIIILDDLSSSYEWTIPQTANVKFIKGNILDDDILNHVFNNKPEYVFHVAAHFANQNSVDNPEVDLMVNGMGILKVLQQSHRMGVKRLVYTSSGCGVYGLESRIPFKEEDVSISLHTPYQVTKLLGELYTNYFHNLYDLPVVNARLFNVFGPGEVPGRYRNVIPNFFFWAMNNQSLPITGDGTETRDWTYVGDIINGLLAMGIHDEAVGEAINLGSASETKVIDMANEINRLTGNPKDISYVSRRNWDVKKQLLSSIEKARKLLDYKPETSFNDGLVQVHRWFQENWDMIQESAEFPTERVLL